MTRHLVGVTDRLDGIGDRNSGDCRIRIRDGLDGPRDQGRGGKRPRRIVDEYDFRPMGHQRLQTGTDRGLAGCTAVNRPQERKTIGGPLEQRIIIGMNDRLNGADPGVLREQQQAAPKYRFAGYFLVLLGKIPTGAHPATGSDHDRRDAGRHVWPFRSVERCDRLTASAASRQNDFVTSGDCCIATLAPCWNLSKLYALTQIA